MSKLWPLCPKCCKEAGAEPSPWPVTCVEETCVKCGEKAWIGAYTDWSWPNGDKAIWD